MHTPQKFEWTLTFQSFHSNFNGFLLVGALVHNSAENTSKRTYSEEEATQILTGVISTNKGDNIIT